MKTLLICLLLLACSGCMRFANNHACVYDVSALTEDAKYWPMVQVPGKVYDVNIEEQRFAVVKNRVYSEKTGENIARHCVHWSDQTVFVKAARADNLGGFDEVLVKCAIGNNLSRADLSGAEKFVATAVTVYPDATRMADIPREPNEVVGVFLASFGDGIRSGGIETGDQMLRVTLGRRATVKVEQNFEPGQLSAGYWSAIVSGADVQGRFVADRVAVSALPDPTEGDTPGLPRVLVIGDSISMNYHDAAKAALAGVANYHRIEGNSFSSQYGMQYVDYWLGDFTKPGQHWDVIQFNHGLHDLKQTGPGAPYASPLEDYKTNLRRIITRLKQTDATLIFATTTPVPKSSGGRYGRQQGAEIAFNQAAREVLADHPEILINDLCQVVNESQVFDAGFRQTADVHYYKPEEQQALGKAVAERVKAVLKANR